MESNESYATPMPHIDADGKAQILIVGGNCLSGHDPETGEELWRGFGINRRKGEFMRVVPSPVSAGGLAIACGPKKEQMLAFRTDLRGDITEKGLAWAFDEKRTPDVCTPAVFDGKLFVLDGDSHVLTCLDAKPAPKSGREPRATATRSAARDRGERKGYTIKKREQSLSFAPAMNFRN